MHSYYRIPVISYKNTLTYIYIVRFDFVLVKLTGI